MEQKLFVLRQIGAGEVKFPPDLQILLNEGWRIVQVSAYGYATSFQQDQCFLLLQREFPPMDGFYGPIDPEENHLSEE